MTGDTLVVVPTYNERENLLPLVSVILGQDDTYSLLVVDDNSPDGTGELAAALASSEDRLRVLHRPGRRGLGTAYIEGFRYALDQGFDYIVQMDADFSHSPADIPRLLQPLKAGRADVTVGSRYAGGGGVRNWPLARRVLSRGGNLYARLILGMGIADATGGFRAFRRGVLESLDLTTIQSNGFGFMIEVSYRCHQLGFRLLEVPILFVDRAAGQSKMSPGIALEATTLVWKLRLGPRGGGMLPTGVKPRASGLGEVRMIPPQESHPHLGDQAKRAG